MKTKKLLLGGHISVAGGLHEALIRGESIGCTAIQIFTRSNRQWAAKKLTQEEVELFKQTWKNTGIEEVIVHMPYLLNLGSPEAKTRHASVSVLKQELERCNDLGIASMVVHPGSHLGQGEDVCIAHITQGINQALADDKGVTKIVLENMAGQGTNIAYDFAHLGSIIDGIEHKKRIGVCFDTCHAFAAGYDFCSPSAYEAMWKQFHNAVGMKYLQVIHLNDSKKPLGSRVDRHEEIGAGQIGLDAFALFMNDERFFDIPKILETPEATLEGYAKNMALLRAQMTIETKRLLRI